MDTIIDSQSPSRNAFSLDRETLFDAPRDVFSDIAHACFDTITLYFYGTGGENIDHDGHSSIPMTVHEGSVAGPVYFEFECRKRW